MRNGTRKSAISRQRILDAAAKAFRRQGYVATRLAEIGKLAGLKPGSIYYHFASKEEILEAVLDIGIRRIFDAVAASLESLPATSTHRQRLTTAMAAHMTALLRHGDYSSANVRNFGQIPAPVRRRHLKVRRDYEELWRRLLRDAQAAGAIKATADLKLLRLHLLGALNWSMEWYRAAGTPIEEIAEVFAGFLLDGVGAGRGPTSISSRHAAEPATGRA